MKNELSTPLDYTLARKIPVKSTAHYTFKLLMASIQHNLLGVWTT